MKLPGILIGGWVAAAGAALTLSGCSGSSSGAGSDEAVPSPSAARPAGCATADELAAQLSDPRVTQIEVVGDCQSVALSTALADDQADLALLVCDAAAQLAYADAAITGVSVTGETGLELARSARDQPCESASPS